MGRRREGAHDTTHFLLFFNIKHKAGFFHVCMSVGVSIKCAVEEEKGGRRGDINTILMGSE